MGGSPDRGGRFGDTGMIELTGKIVVVAIFLLFFVVMFVFFLHLYAKWFWYRRQEITTTTTRRRRRFDFAAGHQEIALVPDLGNGLDPSVLKAIPVLVFDPQDFKDGLECAVCLCEFSQGERARLLPKCNHGFHIDCIDMWFLSHSTCPLCRNPVSAVSFLTREAPNFPTNVLIWGDESQVRTFGPGNPIVASSSLSSSSRPDGGMSVIDIPRQMEELQEEEEEEEEEQKSGVPTRLRSLKRLLSGNKKLNPSCSMEQGARGQN